MYPLRRLHRLIRAGGLLSALFVAGIVAAASPVAEVPAEGLKQADALRTSNHPKFVQLMARLVGEEAQLSPQQRIYLRYLQAWETSYQGDYRRAGLLLNNVIAQSNDATLRFRAGTTLVNMLVISSHFEEAFSRVSELLDELPKIVDKDARIQALGVVATLYDDAGQYDLGLSYASQMLQEDPSPDGQCKGRVFQVQSLFASGNFAAVDAQARDAIDTCIKASELLYANVIRTYVASMDIEHGHASAAIGLLQKYHPEVKSSGYSGLISRVDALLARAYWNKGDDARAQQYALAALENAASHEFTKPLTSAYETLYQISKKRGDLGAALGYHEKYMAADKGYLNEFSAKAMAYQVVKQQVAAKKVQIGTLNKQNQILQLQQALGDKAMETNRLYMTLLLTVLASIALWSYRLKRSQMSFMKLARRDGLTGIFNRQHFVESAEQRLKYCEKSGRVAGLIVIDLDHFKTINDTHGHAVGDHILRRAVAACEAHLHSTDVFGRLGGEEFGILMPECDKSMVASRADLIRVAIASVSGSEDAPGVEVSASFGISSTAESGYYLRQLLIHADKALYDAKREGRNRVVVFDDVEMPIACSDLQLQRI